MAGRVLKKRRLVNAASRRRRMTPKQIKYFGTARQKAGLRNRRNAGPLSTRATKKRLKKLGAHLKGPGGGTGFYARKKGKQVLKRFRNQGVISSVEHAAERAVDRVERAAESAIGAVTSRVGNRHRGGRRSKNVGEILTVVPAMNPGTRRKRKMATRARNRRGRASNRGYRRRANRRKHPYTWTKNRHRPRSNPKVVVRYRNRSRRHNYRRRRNPGMLTGNAGVIVGILGGAAVTKIIMGFLPANLTSGWTGYLATGVVAMVAGQVAGKMFKNRSLGNWITTGGLLIVGLQLAGQFLPAGTLPFGLSPGTSGLGLLTSSNFYVPQVNLPGSMASFVTPAGIPAPVVVPATSMRGLGAMNQGLRRVGRMR